MMLSFQMDSITEEGRRMGRSKCCMNNENSYNNEFICLNTFFNIQAIIIQNFDILLKLLLQNIVCTDTTLLIHK